MTVPESGWAQINALLRARNLAAAPEPVSHNERSYACAECQAADAELAALVSGLELVIPNPRPAPAGPLVCDCD
jgi:hypothetical protein